MALTVVQTPLSAPQTSVCSLVVTFHPPSMTESTSSYVCFSMASGLWPSGMIHTEGIPKSDTRWPTSSRSDVARQTNLKVPPGVTANRRSACGTIRLPAGSPACDNLGETLKRTAVPDQPTVQDAGAVGLELHLDADPQQAGLMQSPRDLVVLRVS
jgi:hypothetical protein